MKFLVVVAVVVGVIEGMPVQPQPRRFIYQPDSPSVRLYPVFFERHQMALRERGQKMVQQARAEDNNTTPAQSFNINMLPSGTKAPDAMMMMMTSPGLTSDVIMTSPGMISDVMMTSPPTTTTTTTTEMTMMLMMGDKEVVSLPHSHDTDPMMMLMGEHREAETTSEAAAAGETEMNAMGDEKEMMLDAGEREAVHVGERDMMEAGEKEMMFDEKEREMMIGAEKEPEMMTMTEADKEKDMMMDPEKETEMTMTDAAGGETETDGAMMAEHGVEEAPLTETPLGVHLEEEESEGGVVEVALELTPHHHHTEGMTHPHIEGETMSDAVEGEERARVPTVSPLLDEALEEEEEGTTKGLGDLDVATLPPPSDLQGATQEEGAQEETRPEETEEETRTEFPALTAPNAVF